MHSSFSSDSTTPMEEMIKKAIDAGLTGICFTEHLDPDYPETPDGLDFSLDIPAYRNTFNALKEKYRDRLQMNFGIELGLQPHLEDYFQELLSKETFDFVIGSSHAVHGYDPYYPQFFEGRKEFSCYMEYFESILENLSVFQDIDTYGHIDYIVRYGPMKNEQYTYGRYQDVLDEILLTLIEKNIALEVNTGGFHYGLGEPNPSTAVIRRYRALGGELLTIGADAHTPDRIAGAFDKTACILKDCGFDYYTVFKDRKPEFLPL